jgi:GDPmannose 4,6-dehydratase
MKTAFISGITGQDGAYLSQLLLEKGYKVIGLVRSSAGCNTERLAYLGVEQQVKLTECDLTDLSQLITLFALHKPDEFYNLAAQSSVSLSFQQPIGTVHFNVSSVLNILEAIRLVNPGIRFYQASSSEMFGNVNTMPITEQSKYNPQSPYAISKLTGHYLVRNYRESYGLFSACGILFNHESYLRGDNFFIKKLLRSAVEISKGRCEVLEVGNLDVKRDFGLSQHYVKAMWLMLQQEKADDFVICSGRSVSLRRVAEHVFERLAIPADKIVVSQELFRPADIEDIYGDSGKARTQLGWHYDIPFFDALDQLIEEEQRNYERKHGR